MATLLNNNTVTYPNDNFVKTEDGLTLCKVKNYRIRNTSWYCECCEVYCNSQSQFDVHLISQKHKIVLNKGEITTINQETIVDENNNNKIEALNEQDEKNLSFRSRVNFSLAEIAQNPLAIKFQIDAVKYLITEDKKKGKFEKFGFYCKTCDAYMTGQIQLIMHVRGAKHQYYHPDEIPGYQNTSTKQYNPTQQKRKTQNKNQEIQNNRNDPRSFEMNSNYEYSCNKYKGNRSSKQCNIQNNLGLQQFYEHFNNSINNTTIYSLPHQIPPVVNKISNETNKENNFIDNRLHSYQQDYKTNGHSFNSTTMHQIPVSFKMNQSQRLPEQNTYNGYMAPQYNSTFNNDRNQHMYAYNLNSIQIKEEPLLLKAEAQNYHNSSETCSQDSVLNDSNNYMNNQQVNKQQYEAQYLYNHPTPPPESNHHQYASNNLQYISKSALEMQQLPRPQQMHTSSPQIIIQSRIGHAIPVMMPINSSPSPISARNISFYHPQIPNHNQQIHQNF